MNCPPPTPGRSLHESRRTFRRAKHKHLLLLAKAASRSTKAARAAIQEERERLQQERARMDAWRKSQYGYVPEIRKVDPNQREAFTEKRLAKLKKIRGKRPLSKLAARRLREDNQIACWRIRGIPGHAVL